MQIEIRTYPKGPAIACIEYREPTVGVYYCGFEADCYNPHTYDYTDRDGAIAQYVGEGCFYDEAENDESDMRSYDYLVPQQ